MSTIRCSVAIVLLALVASEARADNLVLNGDFENNTAPSTLTNLSNAQFNAIMADATAFGTAQEIDLAMNSDLGIPAESGHWKLGINIQPGGPFDAFSLKLSSALVAGATYNIQYFAAEGLGFPSDFDIGISSSATDFGTFLFADFAHGPFDWTQFNHSFVAPFGASFLTVRSSTEFEHTDRYSFVDNFSLTPGSVVPEPSSLLIVVTAGPLLGCGYLRARAGRREGRADGLSLRC